MKYFITLIDQGGIFRKATLFIPAGTHICPGMDLILKCNKQNLRIPIDDVAVQAHDGSTVLQVSQNFENIDKLIGAPELEWFAAPS